VADHVIVGQDPAVLIEDEAGAAARNALARVRSLVRLALALWPLALAALALIGLVREETLEEVAVGAFEVELRGASALDVPLGFDRHDRGERLVRDLRERAVERIHRRNAAFARLRQRREAEISGQDESHDDAEEQNTARQHQNFRGADGLF